MDRLQIKDLPERLLKAVTTLFKEINSHKQSLYNLSFIVSSIKAENTTLILIAIIFALFIVILIITIYIAIRHINLEKQVKKVKDRITSNNYELITIEHL